MDILEMGWNHTNSASSRAECKDISQAPTAPSETRLLVAWKKEIYQSFILQDFRRNLTSLHFEGFHLSIISCFQASDTGMLVWVVDFGLRIFQNAKSTPQAAAQKWGCIKTLMRLLWITSEKTWSNSSRQHFSCWPWSLFALFHVWMVFHGLRWTRQHSFQGLKRASGPSTNR